MSVAADRGLPGARGGRRRGAAALTRRVRPPSLTANLVWLYGGELGAKLLALVAFGFLGRMLGTERYGELEFAIAVVFVLNLVQEAGLMPYGAREAAKRPEATLGLAARIVWVRALVAAGALLLLGLIAWGLSSGGAGTSETAVELLLLCGLVLLPAPLLLSWVFQARDEMTVVAGTSLLRQAVMAGGVFLLVRSSADAWAVPCCDALGLLAAVAVQHVLFRRRVGALRLRGGLAGAGVVLREAMPIAVSSLAWALRVFLPVIAMGVLSAPSATGLFASGHRLVTALHAFVWLYFFNLLPSLSRAFIGPDRAAFRALTASSLQVSSWAVLTGCLALTALAPALLPAVYGAEFEAAAAPFQVAVWMVAAALLSGHQRWSLIACGRQADELRASLIGAATAAAGCLVLLRWPDPMVAAAVFVTAELVTLVAADRMLSRRVESVRLLAHLWRPLSVLLPAAAAVWLLLPGRPWTGAALALGAGAVGARILWRLSPPEPR